MTFLSLKNYVNVAPVSNKEKNVEKFVWIAILKVTDENSRIWNWIRIRIRIVSADPDLDPYLNITDSQRWFYGMFQEFLKGRHRYIYSSSPQFEGMFLIFLSNRWEASP